MNSRIRNWLGVLLFAMAACPLAMADSMKPAPPRGGDPFTGIVDRSTLTQSSAGLIPDVASKRIAVILSDATEKHLKWCEVASHGWDANTNYQMRMQRGQGYIDRYTRLHQEAYDPKKVVGGAVEPLLRKAASVEVIENYAEFLKGGFDLLAVVDITFVNIVPRYTFFLGAKSKAGLYMNVQFVDRKNAIVGVVETGETRDVRLPPEFMDDAIAIRTAVVAQYQASMDGLLGPDKPEPIAETTAAMVGSSTGASDGMAKSGIAEQLKELDDLIRRELVTPAEAESMRKKILGL